MVLLSVNSCGNFADDAGETANAGFVPRTYEQEFGRVCGANKATGIQGVDVSKYQGTFNWAGVKSARGIKFGFARISDGTTYIDSTFDRNWREMKNQGILRGAYQYFRPGQSATAQANMVVNKVGRLGRGDLPVVVDVESTDGQSKATIVSRLRTWLQIVEQGTGKKPIIYTAAYFWRDNVGSTAFGAHPLWVAHYGADCPLVPDGWSTWTFWQYCGGDQYCLHGENYDVDVFNGSLAELQAFANGGVDWSASYVNQTFPLAASAVQMVPGQVLSGYIELKNTGGKTWNNKTKMATTEARDRNSLFADASWLAPNRPAGVTGTVAPGETFRFEFNLRAPQELGSYHEYFGLVQEGAAWFSDSGQGGPPDDQLQVWIEVVKADFAGKFVAQSFPLASEGPVTMEVGESVDGWIELKNIGKKAWTPEKTRLAPTPRDEASPLHHASWESATRVSAPDKNIEPGETFRFPVTLTATETGDFTQTFGLVHEGTTWFSSAPKGGGPADDVIKIHVVVGDAVPSEDTGNGDAGQGDAGFDDAGFDPADAGFGDTGGDNSPDAGGHSEAELGPLVSVSKGKMGGCSVPAGSTPRPGALVLAGLLGAVALVGRRRR